MNRSQLENLYKVNGLNDYMLKTTDDLLKVHGIDFKAIRGYNRLDDLNKTLYERFIVNIYNACGLESRATLVPKGIYYVEETDYLIKEFPEDEHYTIAGWKVLAIDKNGIKTVLQDWIHYDYKDYEIVEGKARNYLRFEYEHQGKNEWLHVIKDGREWY